ncbi:Mss4p nuclear export, partial [Coemansia aciculifera]
TSSKQQDNGSDDEGEGEDKEMVDVDFEFFDPKPIDFHSLKQLLVASFGDDAEDVNLSGLVDLILSQNTIGSTVKFTGDENPYAFLTVLNMHVHSDKEPIQQIKAYLLKKAEKKGGSATKLAEILNGPGHVGLLLNERVVNMPPQVTAPMLKMLVEEMTWAVEDGEPYDFEYYVLLAPMYRETEAANDDDDDEKEAKKPKGAPSLAIDAYAHAEDEFVEEFACAKFDYKFSRSKRAAESRNSFADTGLAPSRRCLIIHKSKIAELIARLEAVLAM